jgi:transglutaminase-like putative cysteine protease
MKFRTACQLDYQIPSLSTFVFNVAVADTHHQRVLGERLQLEPELVPEEYVHPETGNRYHRFSLSGGRLRLRYEADVESTPSFEPPDGIDARPPDTLPLYTLPYLLPSRYCQSDHLMRLAYREFGGHRPSYQQVAAICNWIHANVDYLVGTTGPLTSAFDTATARAGVCRDFAHLGIAFCRAINIPARFVSGYAHTLRPPDFHAMFEAWLGDRWYLFDPTRQIVPENLVRIGVGRDAADVSFALIFGPARMTGMQVWAHADAETPGPAYTNANVAAVSSA